MLSICIRSCDGFVWEYCVESNTGCVHSMTLELLQYEQLHHVLRMGLQKKINLKLKESFFLEDTQCSDCGGGIKWKVMKDKVWIPEILLLFYVILLKSLSKSNWFVSLSC